MGSMLSTLQAKQSEHAAKVQLNMATLARRAAVLDERYKALAPFIDEFNDLRYELKSTVALDTYCHLNRVVCNNGAPLELRSYLLWDPAPCEGCSVSLYVVYNSLDAIQDSLAANHPEIFTGMPKFMSVEQTRMILKKMYETTKHMVMSSKFSKRLFSIETDGRFKHWEDYRKLEPTFFPDEAMNWVADELFRHMILRPDPQAVASGDAMLAGKGRRKKS